MKGWGLRLVGIYGLTAVIIIIGFLMWDKNEVVSRVLLVVGVLLSIAIVISTLFFRHEEIEIKKYKARYG